MWQIPRQSPFHWQQVPVGRDVGGVKHGNGRSHQITTGILAIWSLILSNVIHIVSDHVRPIVEAEHIMFFLYALYFFNVFHITWSP